MEIGVTSRSCPATKWSHWNLNPGCLGAQVMLYTSITPSMAQLTRLWELRHTEAVR